MSVIEGICIRIQIQRTLNSRALSIENFQSTENYKTLRALARLNFQATAISTVKRRKFSPDGARELSVARRKYRQNSMYQIGFLYNSCSYDCLDLYSKCFLFVSFILSLSILHYLSRYCTVGFYCNVRCILSDTQSTSTNDPKLGILGKILEEST